MDRKPPLVRPGNLPTVRLGLLAAMCPGVLAFGASSALAVPLTQISADPFTNMSATSFHATEVEPDTYSNGSTEVAAFQAGRFADGGASDIGWATTTNAGASWTNDFLPGTTPYSTPAGPYARLSDPSVAYDTKHGAWVISSLALNASLNGTAVIVDSSTNGGTIWSPPVAVDTATGAQSFDKDWITCDDNSSSPHWGNCYAEWDDDGNGNLLHMAFSTDGGMTWTQSTVPSDTVIGGQPVAQPNGDVIVPIDNANETAIESFVSTDGGMTYSGPNAISTITAHPVAPAAPDNMRTSPLPSAGVDGGGEVYVAWQDCRFRSGCPSNDIVFSSSSDGVKAFRSIRRPARSTTSSRGWRSTGTPPARMPRSP